MRIVAGQRAKKDASAEDVNAADAAGPLTVARTGKPQAQQQGCRARGVDLRSKAWMAPWIDGLLPVP